MNTHKDGQIKERNNNEMKDSENKSINDNGNNAISNNGNAAIRDSERNNIRENGKTAKNSPANLAGRYGLFLVGLFIASLGVALSTKAGLGTSPVASVPYSVSLMSSLFSFGGWLNLWSVIQISVQVLLLRKKCNPIEIIIQTVLAFAYGYLTNFSVYLLRGLTPDSYAAQFACMLAGCFVLAFGIWLQFMGKVAMLPGEAMNRAISIVTGRKYENIKIVFDVAYILISVILGLCFLGGLKGVREGSIIAAVLIGNIIKLYNTGWKKLTKKDLPLRHRHQ